MSNLLVTLEWYKADSPDVQVANLSPITDAISIKARKGLDIKNNLLDIELKNANSKYVQGGDIQFKEEDLFKLYVKNTSDGSDIAGSWETSSDLIGVYYLEEFSHNISPSTYRIGLSCVDKAFILFNKVFTNTYGVVTDDYWTAPGIMRSVSRINCSIDGTNGYIGTDNDSGSYFSLETRFLSEGGYITDYRVDTTTQLNGSLSDSATTITIDSTTGFKDSGTLVIGTEHIYYTNKTATTFTGCVRGIDDTTAESYSTNEDVYQGFPIVDLTKVWKPIYEWLSELGQTQYTNYDDETEEGGVLNYNRAFLLWIDEDNKIRWLAADDTVDTDYTIGSDELYEVSLTKSVFDSVNMVIYNIGEDMYGVGAVWYWYDVNTNVQTLKMRYQPMTELIDTILNKEYQINSGDYPAAAAGDSNRRFPSAYPVTPSFLADANRWETVVRGETATTSVTSDTEFNNMLRYASFWRGRAEAQSITAKLSGLRYRGRVTLRGTKVNPGDLITVTDANTGLDTQKVRVVDVSQNITNGQWSTSLEVEEDEETA